MKNLTLDVKSIVVAIIAAALVLMPFLVAPSAFARTVAHDDYEECESFEDCDFDDFYDDDWGKDLNKNDIAEIVKETEEVIKVVKDVKVKNALTARLAEAKKLTGEKFGAAIDAIWDDIPEAAIETVFLDEFDEEFFEEFDESDKGAHIKYLEEEINEFDGTVKKALMDELQKVKNAQNQDLDTFLTKVDALWDKIDTAFLNSITTEEKKEEVKYIRDLLTDITDANQKKVIDDLIKKAEQNINNTATFFDTLDQAWEKLEAAHPAGEAFFEDDEYYTEYEGELTKAERNEYIAELRDIVQNDISDQALKNKLLPQIDAAAKIASTTPFFDALDKVWDEVDSYYFDELSPEEQAEFEDVEQAFLAAEEAGFFDAVGDIWKSFVNFWY